MLKDYLSKLEMWGSLKSDFHYLTTEVVNLCERNKKCMQKKQPREKWQNHCRNNKFRQVNITYANTKVL